MKESERIDYLVKRLAGNNAKQFAEKCSIDPKAISNMRHGIQKIGSYAKRISTAYPEVSMDWLLTGNGKAIKTDGEKEEVIKRLDSLEKEIRRLSRLVEHLEKKLP